jgi:hypothetical protein
MQLGHFKIEKQLGVGELLARPARGGGLGRTFLSVRRALRLTRPATRRAFATRIIGSILLGPAAPVTTWAPYASAPPLRTAVSALNGAPGYVG